jgi:NAD(P)H-hydrate epimerase
VKRILPIIAADAERPGQPEQPFRAPHAAAPTAAGAPALAQRSLLDDATLRPLLEAFYATLTRDPLLAPYFESVDLAAHLPRIAADAHKGTRRYVAVVGGGAGMAGAAALAVRAALASGVGIVRALVAPESVPALQALAPEALSGPWPEDAGALERTVASWAHALLVGPGLGQSPQTRALVETILARWHGPVVLDADALNLFAGDVPQLASLLAGRPALVTPHVAEFARLAGGTASDALARRFDTGAELAARLQAVVLLKGVPTVLAAPDGRRLVTATGTPALATGGSGDVLGGIAATLLAQTPDPLVAGALAAWFHGRAAERATRGRPARGASLARVLAALPHVWRVPVASPRYPVLASLPCVRGTAG